ncbi:DUF4091 domain-containing protein [Cohnella sp. WQ 127256]|uniref:DUF4091 domain-containing protein n=1 Tax=Cohnella sp. WQ 127256 TaxID=2938790 RepID=UPI0021195E6A|nr:DUF4091 domain-containing protein [Cohnella sp. WQ 127256]
MNQDKIQFETRCLSSLIKVFADTELNDLPFTKAAALGNETYAFQIAYRSDRGMKGIRTRVESELSHVITIRQIGLVPSELPIYEGHDDDILRSTPGLYPDPLYPIEEDDGIVAYSEQWRSLWVSVDLNERIPAQLYPIGIVVESVDGEKLGEETFELEVLPALLPEQKLIHTEWFHTDCLATQYGVEIWSEEHWQLIDSYVQTAAKHGINMILTPLFTPPLDTKVGGERPTVQLVDVFKEGENYRFDLKKLQRWIDLCSSRGIHYYEFSHLYTQWGASHAPKIMARVNGEYRQLFGWETDAVGEAYQYFITQLLTKLVSFIQDNDLSKRCFFHVSDEPSLAHLETYRKSSELVRSLLGDLPVLDCISDYSFYEQGLIGHPVCANNHIEPFLDHDVSNLWTYYCCVQYKEVSNRFFTFPSYRNRIIGMQLYKFQIAGFLHWGYNFWYSQYSIKRLNPFQITDAGAAFASGDAYLVYPGEQGPMESIRLEILYEALQDLRALELLESLIGREQVLSLLESDLAEPITFSNFPRSDLWLLKKRQEINQAIKDQCSVGKS